jgi:Cu/Ag efflux pump CusA
VPAKALPERSAPGSSRNGVARYGLTMEDVADTVAAALGGRPAGQT